MGGDVDVSALLLPVRYRDHEFRGGDWPVVHVLDHYWPRCRGDHRATGWTPYCERSADHLIDIAPLLDLVYRSGEAQRPQVHVLVAGAVGVGGPIDRGGAVDDSADLCAGPTGVRGDECPSETPQVKPPPARPSGTTHEAAATVVEVVAIDVDADPQRRGGPVHP